MDAEVGVDDAALRGLADRVAALRVGGGEQQVAVVADDRLEPVELALVANSR